MLRKKTLFVIAALFATLFGVLLPARPQWAIVAAVRLIATGQKNAAAKASEVWLDAEITHQLLANVEYQDPAWEMRGGSTNEALHWRRVLVLALPALCIYTVLLLAFSPALMSLASITPWNQLVTGRFDDSHSVLSMLFDAIPDQFYPAPAVLTAFQAILLAVVGAMAISEAVAWGLRGSTALVAAFVFPLLPTNFLLASTMWKDVPFATALLLLAVLSARQVRLRFNPSNGSLISLTFAGLLVVGLRHNGPLIAPPFFPCCSSSSSEARGGRVRVGVGFLPQGVSPTYKAFYAFDVLETMENAHVLWQGTEKALIEETLPLEAWKAYRCDNDVPLYWNARISHLFLAHHQRKRTPLVVYNMPLSREFGLSANAELPKLKEKVLSTHEGNFAKASTLHQRALYAFVGLFVLVMRFVRCRERGNAVRVPMAFNGLSLALMAGSHDYRYVWRSVICLLVMVLLGASIVCPGAGATLRPA